MDNLRKNWSNCTSQPHSKTKQKKKKKPHSANLNPRSKIFGSAPGPAKTQISLGIHPVWSVFGVREKKAWVLSYLAEWLALPTSDHGVAGSNPAGGEILPEPKRHFIAQSLSYSPFHRLEMTEILLKGHKTLTHPSLATNCSHSEDWSDWQMPRLISSLGTHAILLVLSWGSSIIKF